MRFVFLYISCIFAAQFLIPSPALHARAADTAPGPSERFSQALSDYESGYYELASAGARDNARLYTGTLWEGRSLFLAARAAAAMGDLDRASEEFGIAAGKSPLLADYADYLLAEAYVQDGRSGEAAALYLRAAGLRPKGPLASDCLLKAGRALVEAKMYDDAVKALERLLSRKPGRLPASEARYLLMSAEMGRGNPKAAAGHYIKLWSEQPGTYLEREAEGMLAEISDAGVSIPVPDASLQFERAEKLSDLGLYRRAAEHYEKALALMPEDHPKRGEALLGIGYARYRSRDTAGAVIALERLIRSGRYPKQEPEASYWLARAFLRSGRDEEFRREARRCSSDYPKHKRAVDSLYVLGVEYAYEKMYPEALDTFREIIRRYPHSELASDALWRLGWTEFSRKEYAEAEKVFKRLYERYPSTPDAARGVYWRARALWMLGDNRTAAELYWKLVDEFGISYYALLAENPGRVLRPTGAVKKHDIPVNTASGPYSDEAFRRAEELRIVGMDEYGVREIMRVEPRYAAGPRGLSKIAAAYARLGEYKRPLELAVHLYRTRINNGRSPIPEKAMRIIFPAAFWDVISREAAAYGVDPFLVAALAREESHFDPEAVSPAGAVGLMQLMPSTAALVCRKLGRPNPTNDGLKQGDYNVPLGVCHLGYLLEKHNGRMVYALAEYNAGPTALKRWKERWPDAPDDVFVENIGYPETRNYVRRVLRNYRVYRELYGG